MTSKARNILTTSMIGVAQRGSATLGTLLIFPYVLRSLGVEAFGLWGAAVSLSMIINIADFGLGPMIISAISRALANGDTVAARRIFAGSFTLAIGIAIILALLTPLAFNFTGRSTAAQVFVIVGFGTAANVPMGIANHVWLGLKRGTMMALWEFVQSLFFVGGLFLCGLVTHDVRFFSAAVYLAIVLANSLNMLTLLIVRADIRPYALPAPWRDVRPLITPSLKFFGLTMLDAMTYLIDTTLALQVGGAAVAGQMAIIQRMALAVTGLLLILSQYIWPHYVDAWVRRDVRWIRRALGVSIAGVSLFSLAILGILGTFGPWLCRLWLRQDIGFQSSTFILLAAWIFTMGVARALATLLNAMHALEFQLIIFSIFIAISLILKFVLPHIFGINGILLGVIIPASVFLIPALAIGIRYHLKQSAISSNHIDQCA